MTAGDVGAGLLVGCRDTGGIWSPYLVAHADQVLPLAKRRRQAEQAARYGGSWVPDRSGRCWARRCSRAVPREAIATAMGRGRERAIKVLLEP